MTTWTTIPKASVAAVWTTVPKAQASNSTQTIVAGTPIGLLLALTYSTSSSVISSKWIDITKATSTSWTPIPKAT